MGKRAQEVADDLSLYVRTFAWLTATPARKDSKGAEIKLPARIEHYKANKLDLPLPDINHEPYFDWLMEIGPTEVAGMGQAPISWRAIADWQRLTGASLTPWDARLLRRLSIDYLTEGRAAEDWTRVAPWSRVPTEAERAANERQLRVVLG